MATFFSFNASTSGNINWLWNESTRTGDISTVANIRDKYRMVKMKFDELARGAFSVVATFLPLTRFLCGKAACVQAEKRSQPQRFRQVSSQNTGLPSPHPQHDMEKGGS